MTRAEWFGLGLALGLSFVLGLAAWVFLPELTVPVAPAIVVALALFSTVLLLSISLHRRRRNAIPYSRPDSTGSLMAAGLEMAAAPDYAAAVKSIVERARGLTAAEAAAFCIWDGEKEWWTLQGTSGEREAYDEQNHRLMRPDHAVQCPLVRLPYRPAHVDVPVVNENRIVGCVCVAGRRRREPASQREWLAALAPQAGVAVTNSRRLEDAGQAAAVVERERLARELHDTLAQLLGFISFKAQAAREYLIEGQTGAAGEQLDKLTSITQDLYADTRELILGLRSDGATTRNLVPALKVYLARFSDLAGVETELEAQGMEQVLLSPAVELQVIRVVQEGLSNVRKHARARHARVRMKRAGEQLCIAIEDDGRGFDVSDGRRDGRYGLQCIRERIESINGTVTIKSRPGVGTSILVDIPLVYRDAG